MVYVHVQFSSILCVSTRKVTSQLGCHVGHYLVLIYQRVTGQLGCCAGRYDKHVLLVLDYKEGHRSAIGRYTGHYFVSIPKGHRSARLLRGPLW